MKKKLICTAVFLLLLLLIGMKISLKPYQVNTNGMAPSILAGEKFAVDKLLFRDSADLEYGDVVAFAYKENSVFIWRLIGRAGDTVSVKNGIPAVNGIKADIKETSCPRVDELKGYKCYEETMFGRTYQIAFKPGEHDEDTENKQNIEQFEIPDGSVFLMGDCRNCAYDCRFTGPVKYEEVIGKALFFYYGRVHGFGELL